MSGSSLPAERITWVMPSTPFSGVRISWLVAARNSVRACRAFSSARLAWLSLPLAARTSLRLRRIGPKNYVTYKGPRSDRQTKTRKEIEVPLGDGAAAADGFIQILQHLGYRPVAVVKKRRKILRLERDGLALEVCLDTVERLGQFVELEIVAPENQLNAARATLLQLANELGLKQSERRSYLELLLEIQKGQPR